MARGILVVLAVLLAAPLGSAYHLSVGARDAVLLGPEETPENPSVSDELYALGTSTACETSDGSLEDLEEAVRRDPFCGRLRYEVGTTFETVSPPDQDIRLEGWTFDGMIATYAGTYGLSTCLPWCLARETRELYIALHDAGHGLGLSPSGEEAWRGDEGWQAYSVHLLLPSASSARQAMGPWEADGWLLPGEYYAFVAFLHDENGVAVNEERLRAVSQDAIASGLLASGPNYYIPDRVCAFTPDARLAAGGPQVINCEVVFFYDEEAGETDDWGVCASPTYVCSTLTPAWRGHWTCSPFFPCRMDSMTEPFVWHYVVSPRMSGCSGSAQPGFPTTGPPFGYLAHDLDVLVPIGSPTGIEPAGAAEWARAAIEGLDPQQVPRMLIKEGQPEPNNPGDTSRGSVEVLRTLDPCDPIYGRESEADPWVDILDSRVVRDATGDLPPRAGLGPAALDLYLNADPDHDKSDRPGPGAYFTRGMVGVFTDRDDDGHYEQAQPDQINPEIFWVGAYPLYWDMWVDENGEPARQAGCRPPSGGRLPAAMEDAGYGPRTGLVQVLYLREATTLFHWEDLTLDVFPEGDTAFVFLSQALGAQRGDPVVENAITAALTALPVTPGRVLFPGDGRAGSDFFDQCREGTGGFTSVWGFAHACQLGCEGDAVVTAYLFELTTDDGTIRDTSRIPTFAPDGVPYAFGQGPHLWVDVDELDG